jgi:FkbM family methyltransferase
MFARGEATNLLSANGEALIQRHFLHACAKSRVRPVIFDVGANVGEWTHSLLQSHAVHAGATALEVHCFEPVPSTFSALTRRLNAFRESILFVQKAVSHSSGVATMAIAGPLKGTNSLHDDGTGSRWINVELCTVDDYCEQKAIPMIHYLKCDAEGHDANVLYGAQRLLNEGRIMTFQFEYNHRWVYSRHYLRDIFERVKGLPYRLGKITPVGLELYKEWHPELERFFEVNYAVVHQNALAWYPLIEGAFDQSNTFYA